MQYSLYLHIPFCRHRCAYCDFNTYAGQEHEIQPYVEALCEEIADIGHRSTSDSTIHTVFIGGGTPSLLKPSQLRTIMSVIREFFYLAADPEITLEANPGTVTFDDMQALRELGINRLSFGMQSANGEELRMLERGHTYLEILQAVSAARRAGFDNLNVDLIYGLPEQKLQTWQTTVQRALDLLPEHISAYALTLEHGTPFGAWTSRGLLPAISSDAAADMYEWICGELEAAGYVQYEISNWAKRGRACKHNLQYWRGLPYLGFGAGAHGYANGYRYSNVRGIRAFINCMQKRRRATTLMDRPVDVDLPCSRTSRNPYPLSEAMIDHHRQTKADDMAEFMMTGLRLTREGIGMNDFGKRFGRELTDVYGPELAELVDLGLLEWVDSNAPEAMPPGWNNSTQVADAIRLTARGRLLGNHAFSRFIS